MNGFLFSYIDTNVPGFRYLKVGSTYVTVPPGYYDFRSYITALDGVLDAVGWSVSFSTTTGLVTLVSDSGSDLLTIYDRTAIYLGLGAPAPSVFPGDGFSVTSSGAPPGCLHLMGATWEKIDVERERVLETTRIGRGYGYVWGGARLWRWKLHISPSSIQSSAGDAASLYSTSKPILSNFVSKGKVQIWMGDDDAITHTESGGKLDGYVVGLDGIRSSSSFGYTSYEASLVIAS